MNQNYSTKFLEIVLLLLKIVRFYLCESFPFSTVIINVTCKIIKRNNNKKHLSVTMLSDARRRKNICLGCVMTQREILVLLIDDTGHVGQRRL